MYFKEFAVRLRERYPQYKDIQDDVLVNKFLSMNPTYRDKVTFEPQKEEGGLKNTVKEIGKELTKPIEGPVGNILSKIEQNVKESPVNKYNLTEKVIRPVANRATQGLPLVGGHVPLSTQEVLGVPAPTETPRSKLDVIGLLAAPLGASNAEKVAPPAIEAVKYSGKPVAWAASKLAKGIGKIASKIPGSKTAKEGVRLAESQLLPAREIIKSPEGKVALQGVEDLLNELIDQPAKYKYNLAKSMEGMSLEERKGVKDLIMGKGDKLKKYTDQQLRAAAQEMAIDRAIVADTAKVAPERKLLEHFYPRVPTKEVLEKIKSNPSKAASEMLAAGEDPKAVESLISDVVSREQKLSRGTLFKHRTLNTVPYIEDPLEVLPGHREKTMQYLSWAKRFGKDPERGIDAALANLKDPIEKAYLSQLLKSHLRFSTDLTSDALSKLTTFAATAQLSRAAIKQAPQGLIGSLLSTSLEDTATALKKTIFDWAGSKNGAARLGLLEEDLVKGLTSESSKGTIPLFGKTDMAGRVLNFRAAESFIDSTIKPALKNWDNISKNTKQEILDTFASYGMDINKSLGTKGMPLSEQERFIRQTVTRWQAYPKATEIPLFLQSKEGRMFRTYKGFQIQWANAMASSIITPLKRGNIAPLAKALGVLSVTGELPADLDAMIKGKKRPGFDNLSNASKHFIENMSMAGAVGILTDMLGEATTKLDMGTLSTAPALSFVGRIGSAVGHAATGNLKPLGKLGLDYGIPLASSKLPVRESLKLGVNVGSKYLANTLFKKPTSEFEQKQNEFNKKGRE